MFLTQITGALEILLKTSSCRRLVAGGGRNSHFLFCLRSESEMSVQNCSFVLLRGQKWTEPNPVLDATRQSREASERSAFTDYSRAKNGRPTGAPAAEPCGREGGGGTPARVLLARSVKSISSLPKERSKNRQRRHRRTAPASEAGGESWRKKAEKGSMVQSDTLKYILCIRRNAYSVLLKRIKHASFTDARSSWLERCRALLYSAFIHVATCRLTSLDRVLHSGRARSPPPSARRLADRLHTPPARVSQRDAAGGSVQACGYNLMQLRGYLQVLSRSTP